MEKRGWKITAIVFVVLFVTTCIFIAWGIWLYNSEVAKTNECYYDICGLYPDARYEGDVCYCYDYDALGYLNIVKTKYVK